MASTVEHAANQRAWVPKGTMLPLGSGAGRNRIQRRSKALVSSGSPTLTQPGGHSDGRIASEAVSARVV
jgi:hypothetical protein